MGSLCSGLLACGYRSAAGVHRQSDPIRAEGRIVDLIRQAHRERADKVPPRLAVNAIRIPSTESPHAHREKSPFGLADKTRIDSMHRK
jgi:hypothetical protein